MFSYSVVQFIQHSAFLIQHSFQIPIIHHVFPTAIALKGGIEAFATFAHPADLSGRHAGHQCVWFHVFGHNGASGDEGALAYRMATDHSAVGTQRGTFAYLGLGIDAMYGKMGARCSHIGEYAARAAEHIVLNLNAFVDGDVVLHTNIVANLYVIAYVDILSERAVFTNYRTFLDMAEMPDFGSFADANIVIDVTAFVYVLVVHIIFKSQSAHRTFDELKLKGSAIFIPNLRPTHQRYGSP